MTITTDLKAISKVKVGTSADYAVVRISINTKRVGPETQTRESYEEIKWDLECLAEITLPTSITALNETLRSELAKIGLAVTLTELGTSRNLPASGAGGSMIGYPRTEITDIPDRSFAQFQAFSFSAISRIPFVDGEGIIEHTTQTDTSTSSTGIVETSVSGKLRMEQGNDATTYINTNIIGPARTAAETLGKGLLSRISVTDDTTAASYSYTVKSSETGVDGVTEANVEDRTTKDITGRRVRTISGYAKGANASTFATSQRVAEAANLKLLREDGPSLPSVPDGRVNFSYQYVAGVIDAAYPFVFTTRFTEQLNGGGGGSEILPSIWFGANPALRLGRKLPFTYTQSTEIEFIGDFANVTLNPVLAADNIIGTPRISKRSDGKLNTLRYEWTYIYSTTVALPDPRTVIGVS